MSDFSFQLEDFFPNEFRTNDHIPLLIVAKSMGSEETDKGYTIGLSLWAPLTLRKSLYSSKPRPSHL